MGLMLKKQRDGSLRDCWYGVYAESDGTRKVVNLNVKWKGTPPESLRVRDPGDRKFEDSRKKALAELATYADEARRKGRAEHLTERLIESKTGRTVEYARLDELGTKWRNLGRETPAGEPYLKSCDAVFERFSEFMATRRPSATFLYEVTQEDASAYMTGLQATYARKTIRDNAKLLNKAFERFLPIGVANPFAGFVGRRSTGESETVHRKPFNPEELTALLDAARGDDFMYPLIVTATCTGMRRGDVCRLPWSAVDFKAGVLTVKTSKTSADVEIPIFKPLRAVLEGLERSGTGLVFPEAASMLASNPDGLTWRFKKIVARAFAEKEQGEEDQKERVSPEDVLEEGQAAIVKNIADPVRRERMLNILRRYCGGASYRQIFKATGYAKSTVSTDLHTVEGLLGKEFMRVRGKNMKLAVKAATQVKRTKGKRAASVRDWHALRATFVTLALAAGVPVELVRRVTGHATVEVVLKHYFRPDRDQFKALLTKAMPKVISGESEQPKPEQELAELAGKLAAGKATEEDRARLRELAAAV